MPRQKVHYGPWYRRSLEPVAGGRTGRWGTRNIQTSGGKPTRWRSPESPRSSARSPVPGWPRLCTLVPPRCCPSPRAVSSRDHRQTCYRKRITRSRRRFPKMEIARISDERPLLASAAQKGSGAADSGEVVSCINGINQRSALYIDAAIDLPSLQQLRRRFSSRNRITCRNAEVVRRCEGPVISGTRQSCPGTWCRLVDVDLC